MKPSITELTAEQSAAIAPSATAEQRRTTLNHLLFPGPSTDFDSALEAYGDVSVLHTRDFLYGFSEDHEHVISLGKGVRLLVTFHGMSEPDQKGMRTVTVTLNGQPRQVQVRDRSAESTAKLAEKADSAIKGHVAAPFAGAVTQKVAVGDLVAAGDTVATIEAMKMEAGISAPIAGKVARLVFDGTSQVDGGDLLLIIE